VSRRSNGDVFWNPNVCVVFLPIFLDCDMRPEDMSCLAASGFMAAAAKAASDPPLSLARGASADPGRAEDGMAKEEEGAAAVGEAAGNDGSARQDIMAESSIAERAPIEVDCLILAK
jgi:hypothetical protein